jgi:hypothetical protein
MEMGKLFEPDFTKNISRGQKIGHAARSAIAFSDEFLKKSGSKSFKTKRAVKDIADAELTAGEMVEAERLRIKLTNPTHDSVVQFRQRQAPPQYEAEQAQILAGEQLPESLKEGEE